MKKTLKKTPVKKAFSLLELIVALFVFSIAMTAVTGIFVSFFKANTLARETQQQLEDVQQAINIMSKKIRTSSLAGTPSASTLRILEYSEAASPQCQEYIFSGGNIRYTDPVTIASGSPTECELATLPAYKNLINTPVTARFIATKSQGAPNPLVGKVTILIEVAGRPIQSTVSLRDYNVSGAN